MWTSKTCQGMRVPLIFNSILVIKGVCQEECRRKTTRCRAHVLITFSLSFVFGHISWWEYRAPLFFINPITEEDVTTGREPLVDWEILCDKTASVCKAGLVSIIQLLENACFCDCPEGLLYACLSVFVMLMHKINDKETEKNRVSLAKFSHKFHYKLLQLIHVVNCFFALLLT